MAAKKRAKRTPKPRKKQPAKKKVAKKRGRPPKSNAGRKKKDIDAEMLGRMGSEGMPLRICAKILGVHKDTILRRFKDNPEMQELYETELINAKFDDWCKVRYHFQKGHGFYGAVYLANTLGIDDNIPMDAMETPADNHIIMAMPDGRLIKIPTDSESSTSLSDARIMACEPQENE